MSKTKPANVYESYYGDEKLDQLSLELGGLSGGLRRSLETLEAADKKRIFYLRGGMAIATVGALAAIAAFVGIVVMQVEGIIGPRMGRDLLSRRGDKISLKHVQLQLLSFGNT